MVTFTDDDRVSLGQSASGRWNGKLLQIFNFKKQKSDKSDNMYTFHHYSPIVTLVGGSGPHEGNIMVNGQPVCDDGSEAHRAATAGVVCRFLMLSNDALQLTILNFTDFVCLVCS